MTGGSPARLLAALAAAAGLAAAHLPPLHAQQGAVEVQRGGPDTLSVATGERGSVAFRLANHGDSEVAGTTVVTVPEGWRAATPAPEVELPARSSVVRVVSFYPAAAAAGVYPLTMELRTRDGHIERDLVQVRVPERRQLSVTVDEAPDRVTAGRPFAVIVRVTNLGNARARFTLSLASSYGITARADTSVRWLDPGGSETIQIQVSPPADLSRAVVHSMRVTAASDTVTAQAVSRVEILPGSRARREPRAGLPAEIRIRASEDPRAGPAVRLQAAGPLRPGGQTRVSALLQGPTRTYSMFGEADLYRLGIQSPRFSLDLGDNLFTLSRLTEPGRQGMGVGGAARLGSLSAGGFVRHDRRSFRPDTQYAAFASLSPIEHLTLRGNWLRSDDLSGRREVLSGEGSLRVPGWFVLRGELGVRPASRSAAHSAELVARRGPVSLSLRHLEGDSAYGGVNAGLSTVSAHLNVRPWRSLHLDGSFQDQTTARVFEATTFESSQRSASLATGWGSTVTVSGHSLERTSSWAAAPTSHSARSLRVRLGLPLGRLTLHPSLETGVGEAGGSGEAHPFWRAGMRTSLRAGPATLSSNLEYFTGGSLHRSVLEEGLMGTGTAALRLGSTNLSVSTHATRYLAPFQRDNLVMDAMVAHRLPFGHTISARVMRRASSGVFQNDQLIALLDYSIPVKIPIGGPGRTATISGRVQDAGGAPLADVVLRVGGRRVVTDRSGRIAVGGLEPGVHYVDIDRSTIGSDRVASVPMPLRIELKPGERQSFDVALLPAGGITVHTSIVRAGSASGRTGPRDPEPMERVVVDFELGEQRIRRQSDSRGIIDIRGLRPGLWKVRIARADLPAFHRFESDSVAVEVTGGGHAEVSFAAVPVQRRVEIVAMGDLVEQPAAGHAAAERPAAPAPDRQPAAAVDLPARREAAPGVLGSLVEPRVPDASAETPGPAPTVSGETALSSASAVPDRSVLPRGFTITVAPGDRSLRDIAALVYLDRELWPRIWLANRDAVAHPDRLSPGRVLRIPPAGPLTDAERAIARQYPEPQN